VYRARSFQPLLAEFSQHDENSVPVRMAAFNESALLHSRQLVREAASEDYIRAVRAKVVAITK
jgi:hypothetical protein